MARYLLTAEDDEMDAWKDAAKKRGVKFSVFVRQALDHESEGRIDAPLPVNTLAAPIYPERTWKGPDFKKPPAEKKQRGR